MAHGHGYCTCVVYTYSGIYGLSSTVQEVLPTPDFRIMISHLLVGRLRTIASFVPQYSIMADIGCDHGLLSVGLSQHCKHVWAIDISPLALQGNGHWCVVLSCVAFVGSELLNVCDIYACKQCISLCHTGNRPIRFHCLCRNNYPDECLPRVLRF